ncbi:MAG: tetratricopeptide repeat protein [Pseudomonas sp.]|uniref:tetratricopeptide repeat protein n=1 Tax=Pseudomonas sp. TaxID=306 RepID=UPI0033989A4D
MCGGLSLDNAPRPPYRYVPGALTPGRSPATPPVRQGLMQSISKRKWSALTQSAGEGNADAQWELGYYLEHGAVTRSGKVLATPDRSAATGWYLLAAQQDDAGAKNALSALLSAGDNPDYKAAIFWAKSAIRQGDASAAYNLGIIYRDLGKPKAAFGQYQLAAAMGDADAHLQIGLCHLLGQGTAIDHGAAQASLNKVLLAPSIGTAKRTREDALYWLALINLMGLGQRRNLGQAQDMLERTNADDDHEQANDILHVIGHAATRRLRSPV